MNSLKIDINKTLSFERLSYNKSIFEKISENGLIIANLSFFLYVTGTNFFKDIEKSEPFGWSLFFLIIVISISFLGLLSYVNGNKLLKIKGVNKTENTKIIKEIVEINNWKIHTDNNELDIINISFLDTQTDYGKQIIVIYKHTDILINCTSFALGKTPNPFNWFSNKNMIRKVETEFMNKNTLQHCI